MPVPQSTSPRKPWPRASGSRGAKSGKVWQLQTAKAQFSEVFRRARTEGPQWVTRQDREAVVIVRAEDFERLSRRSRQPDSVVEFFATSPMAGVELDLNRAIDFGRDVDL
jgi:antitoxin Phd